MITINNLNKKYGEKELFKNYNLEIPDKSFVIINGESGRGKTTLLNMIGGLEKPDSGEICIDGTELTSLKNKKDFYKSTVGFLFQNFTLLENKTVRQNLSMIKKDTRTDCTIEQAIRKVGLENELDKKVYKLSGGEQQRVALARLIIKNAQSYLQMNPQALLMRKTVK